MYYTLKLDVNLVVKLLVMCYEDQYTDRKYTIPAIRYLRDITQFSPVGLGLRECKEVIEALSYNDVRPNRINKGKVNITVILE